ncbi:hypothetical protein D3C75_1133450 [compost metagenome]
MRETKLRQEEYGINVNLVNFPPPGFINLFGAHTLGNACVVNEEVDRPISRDPIDCGL